MNCTIKTCLFISTNHWLRVFGNLCRDRRGRRKSLKKQLFNKITVLSGNSGVGKSTLINKVLLANYMRTSEISDVHNTGMHTTTFSEMLPIEEGGYIIDTPGIKGFGSFNMEPEEICSYFKEIFEFSKDCKFNNCSHTHEPGCAVLKALEKPLYSRK